MKATPSGGVAGFGPVLRDWRHHRGLSQLDLSLEAGVSPRHLSFLETGRSSPSQEMVVRLLDGLDVPLWDRNRILLAAGYAPAYGESSLDDDRMARVRSAVRMLLERQEPYPAYAIDGSWEVVEANRPFLAGLASVAAEPAAARNVLRLLCDPRLLRPRVVNWREVAGAVLRRVRRQLDAPEPPAGLASVVDEIRAFPEVEELLHTVARPARPDLFIPVEVMTSGVTLRWMTALITFSGALDAGLEELVVECFFPADAETEELAQAAGDTAAG